MKSRIKLLLQRQFDSLMVYSTFCKDWLVEMGHPPENIVVATNVGDTRRHLEAASKMTATRSEARQHLGLPDRFTVLYAGTLDANKRPEVLLDLADLDSGEDSNYLLAGVGPMLGPLRGRARAQGLSNVFLPGHVGEKLPMYYRASDVLIVPGRGGIVFSEAMAWELPIITHLADGTEYDLIGDGETGRRLSDGSARAFHEVLESLRRDPEMARRWGENGRRRLLQHYGTEDMIMKVSEAISRALARRGSFCAT